MRTLAMAALGVCLMVPGLAAADGTYRLYQGQPFSGLTTKDGHQVRSNDTVCRDRDCYQVYRSQPVDRSTLRQLGIESYSFDAVASADGVSQDGKALLLPAAFGWELYRNARNDEWATKTPNS
ncbi:hypothetical protein [Motiliproteus sediminis]|uniref:hypothetical protein n=1 Tax=Motiliproteus sediminis TaxID=1468178 RepID=UPI001AF00DB9|nr:hypothetical protein [Motiliproteus sediminis]